MRMPIVAAAAAVLASLTSVPAHASDVRACVSSATWTFSPKLTLTNTTGNAHVEWSNTCVRESVNVGGNPLQETAIETSTGSFNVSYTGNCLVALLSGHFVATLVGGTALVVVNADASTAVNVLVPDAVCNEEVASSVGQENYITP
jgi:hypothetical protein